MPSCATSWDTVVPDSTVRASPLTSIPSVATAGRSLTPPEPRRYPVVVTDEPAPRVVTVPPRAMLGDAVRPTVAEIDLGAIRHNVRAVRAYVRAPVWGVVKADAYGHGAGPVAHAMVAAGAEGLCVALVEEGLELRRAGILAPILVMSGIYRDALDDALAAGLTPVIYDPSQIERLAARTAATPIHLKVDTGMARLGIVPAELEATARRLRGMAHVQIDGLMTHFASADLDDPSFTHEQLRRFSDAATVLRTAGLSWRVQHAANSAGAFRFSAGRFDFVRTGIVLYGVAPFPHDGPALLPAFRFRTEITALREVPSGATVGYGGAYRCGQPTVVATIPVGYADGYFRRLSSDAEVLVRGARARVVGNVSMDMAMLDVTRIAKSTGVTVGDEVVLIGSQRGPAGSDTVRAEEIASRVGTIPYEVLCAVSRRVPRSFRNATEQAGEGNAP